MRNAGWGRFVWRYVFSRRWRTLYEVEAYRISIGHGMHIDRAAYFLSTKYWLRVSPQQAKVLLRQSDEL